MSLHLPHNTLMLRLYQFVAVYECNEDSLRSTKNKQSFNPGIFGSSALVCVQVIVERF